MHASSRRFRLTAFALGALVFGCASLPLLGRQTTLAPGASGLTIRQDERTGAIRVFRAGRREPVLTQQANAGERPYIHPIAAPDGRGVLTQARPAHHPHQTGLYWGFTRLNGRDYFHNPGGDYWRRVSAAITPSTDGVQWQTVYDLLDSAGAVVMTETQRWRMRERSGRFVLDLEWRGEAKSDVTIGQHDYGGLFLRMPWRKGIKGEVVNAARQRNERAEGQRAMWIDVGMQVDGRTDPAHIAIFDHPDNPGYPQAWRVDGELGVGSSRTRTAARTIARGQTEVIRHQLIVHTGALKDVEMTAAWEAFTGNGSTYSTSALWAIAQKEGREAVFLTPEAAVAKMTTLDGYRVNAWASEPMIAQPMAFCWDDRGRLWVAENRDYESRGTGFSSAGTSRILILEDTDRDGAADKRTVFMEGIVFPAAIAVGFDGVFIGAPPNLLFVPDRNGDDKADMDGVEVRLTGWGIRDRHETINSLHWGPDGWLYGLQGFATPSKIRKPDGQGRLYQRNDPFPDVLAGDGVEINGGVWRYHPTKDVFEVVAHGFSNPWGIDHDANGQLFISACVIPHLWHVVPGGIYQRQGGQHFNPYVYSDIQTIADHRHRSAHGGARVYQSDAFPQSQRGRIFMANIHEHAVLSDVLARKGSGFTASHGDDFLLANNAQWIGFSLEIGPEGAIYVLDWHDADICGQDVLHQETGRIFRITPTTSNAKDWPGRYDDLRTMTDAQLVALQQSPSDWHARRARLILQNREAKGALQAGTHDRLRQMFRTAANPDWRMRAMWALHVTGGWTPDALMRALDDPAEYVRAWAVQLLAEDRAPSRSVLDRFAQMAHADRSAVVRLYLAAALQRLDEEARWPVAAALMSHAEDAGDHNLPTMIWLAVEPLVAGGAPAAIEQASRGKIPLVSRHIARRAVDAQAIEPLVAAIARRPPAERELLEGMRDALEGRFDVAAPAGWADLSARMVRAGGPVASLALDISRQFGDTEAARQSLAAVRNPGAPLQERRRAIQVLTAQRRPQLAAELPAALDDPALRVDAIRAVAAFDEDALGLALLKRYPGLSGVEKNEALQALASRRRYGRLLTDAIAKQVIPRRDVPSYVARQLLRVVGAGFTDVWGPVAANPGEESAFAKYRTLLSDTAIASASPVQGRSVFQRTCGACHTLHGEGGSIGPDLTGSNRGNVEYLLFNVLNPNGEVQDAYRMVLVTTRDGRTLSGNVVAETDRQVTLRVINGEPAVIPTSDIQSRETTDVSMMPPGLFDALTDREVLDLAAYLRSAQPVKTP
jgi:putative membrane-bound dehydrogenase-like protein